MSYYKFNDTTTSPGAVWKGRTTFHFIQIQTFCWYTQKIPAIRLTGSIAAVRPTATAEWCGLGVIFTIHLSSLFAIDKWWTLADHNATLLRQSYWNACVIECGIRSESQMQAQYVYHLYHRNIIQILWKKENVTQELDDLTCLDLNSKISSSLGISTSTFLPLRSTEIHWNGEEKMGRTVKLSEHGKRWISFCEMPENTIT